MTWRGGAASGAGWAFTGGSASWSPDVIAVRIGSSMMNHEAAKATMETKAPTRKARSSDEE
jgi:hypothetical protein